MADRQIQEGSQTSSKSGVEINRAAPQEIVPSTAGKSPIALWRPASPRRWRRIGFLLLIFAVAAGVGGYWLKHSNSVLPLGIASGNGRIEADEIDIATKFAGRVAELLVDEGSTVGAGQVVARMDTRDLQASLQKAQEQVKQAEHALDETHSNVEQQRTQLILATQEWERTQSLLTKGFATRELSDQRRQQVDAATAALNAANSRVEQANHALEAARHEVELLQVNIADNALVAPRDGRIQYRIANLGEVLPAGGKVLTMLDLASVYIVLSGQAALPGAIATI